MSAEKVGHAPTIYELKANDGLAPFRVVMEQDYWRLLGRFQLLLALAKRYASECEDCNGTGRAPAFADNVPGDITKGAHEVEVDCVACADIRAAIEKAEGGA